ncbi:MAG: hypothetical protein CMJ83_07140 [Planctomycetes bacterium]|nr:hypothetical protein [Planctomycetota bacterium]
MATSTSEGRIRAHALSRNSSDLGGAVYSHDSCTPTLINCSFSGNLATTAGGALYSEVGSFAELRNCVLWGDTGGEISGLSVNVNYSCIEGGYSGVGNIDADPRYANPAGDDLHLQSGSPCIDRGSGVSIVLPSTDLDGDPRSLYLRVDMGLDEWLPPRLVTLNLNQSQGPGSIEIRNQTTTPGYYYVTLITNDAANAGSALGTGPWGGLFMNLGELLAQIGVPQPPFSGFLDAGGASIFSSGSLPPSWSGIDFYLLTHTFANATSGIVEVSPVATITLL